MIHYFIEGPCRRVCLYWCCSANNRHHYLLIGLSMSVEARLQFLFTCTFDPPTLVFSFAWLDLLVCLSDVSLSLFPFTFLRLCRRDELLLHRFICILNLLTQHWQRRLNNTSSYRRFKPVYKLQNVHNDNTVSYRPPILLSSHGAPWRYAPKQHPPSPSQGFPELRVFLPTLIGKWNCLCADHRQKNLSTTAQLRDHFPQRQHLSTGTTASMLLWLRGGHQLLYMVGKRSWA